MVRNLLSLEIFGFLATHAVVLWAAPVEVKFEQLKSLLESRNVRVQAAQLELSAAKDREGSLLRSFFPELQLQAAQQTFKTGINLQKTQPSYGAEIKLNLFRGGKDQLQSEIHSLQTGRKTVQLKQVVNEELQKVREIYWEIVFSQEQMGLIESALKMNTQNLASAERRIKGGVATESDRVEFEMKAVDLKRELSSAQVKLANLKREMAVHLKFKLDSEFTFPKNLEHSHDYEVLLEHQESDHDFLFKDDELKGKQSELTAKSKGRDYWPQVEAFAAYNQFAEQGEFDPPRVSLDDRNSTIFGVRVRLGLDNVFESSVEAQALAKEARANLKVAEIKKDEAEAVILNEMSELRLLHDQVHDAEENIRRAEKYYQLTRSEYQRGVKNSPDILGASERLFENRLKRLQIIKDFQIAKSHILTKIGK